MSHLEAAKSPCDVGAPGIKCALYWEYTTQLIDMKWKKRKLQLEALRARHGRDRSLARPFPDLSVEPRTAPCSNRITEMSRWEGRTPLALVAYWLATSKRKQSNE